MNLLNAQNIAMYNVNIDKIMFIRLPFVMVSFV